MEQVRRRNFDVTTVDGVRIAVREVRPEQPVEGRTPVVLLHGTRPDGVSEYDLPVEGGSLAADLAARGHVVYIPDARGYGRSERGAQMDVAPEDAAPFARCMMVTRDIDAAVEALRGATGVEAVGLMGWGVGATCMLMHAAIWPEKVSHLILYNPLYGGGSSHPRYRDHPLEDPDHPGRFNRAHYGGYSYNDPAMLMKKWADSIPVDDKDSWRDPAVAAAFERSLLEGDATSGERTPPSYRSPNGMLEDSLYMGRGTPLVHASQVYASVLIVRPELDYFARPEDVAALRRDLVNARDVRLWEPEGATHFVILDRPERGRAATIETIHDFLGD